MAALNYARFCAWLQWRTSSRPNRCLPASGDHLDLPLVYSASNYSSPGPLPLRVSYPTQPRSEHMLSPAAGSPSQRSKPDVFAFRVRMRIPFKPGMKRHQCKAISKGHKASSDVSIGPTQHYLQKRDSSQKRTRRRSTAATAHLT